MSNVKELAKMYDALWSIKLLDAPVKLDIRIPCRMVLLLAMAVEQGMSSADPGNVFKKIVSEEDQGKVTALVLEILRKGELEEFYQKLRELGNG
jgi:hypothetical protein